MFPSALSAPTRRRSFRPRLEALEDRLVLTHWPVTSPIDNGGLPNTLRWAVAHTQNGDTIDIERGLRSRGPHGAVQRYGGEELGRGRQR
jgi:hypothetical protein